MTDALHSFTLADMVRQQARVLPDATAIVDGDDRHTFADMDRGANRWANWLAARSVGPGDRVAWHGPGDVRTLHLLFAVAKLGATLVPLNLRNTAEETARALETAAPTLILSTTPLDGALDAEAEAPAVQAAPHDEPATDPDDERPVLGVFTGAFSGDPKLALLTHRGIVTQSLVIAAYRLIEPGATRYLASGPMFHVGVHLKLLANYLFGGLGILAPQPDAATLCRLIEHERVTSALLFTPTIDRMIQANADRRYDLSSLCDVPAEPSDPSDDAWYEMTSCRRAAGPTGYGQTETYAMVAFEARGPSGTGAFGRPSPVAAVGVSRADGTESAPGEPGEIVVRGPQVMAGYLGEPVGAQHHTGDLGVLHPDGTFDFIGPIQEVIKTGMENVYPAEVEIALRRHPAVTDACVIGVHDPRWGSSVRAVVETAADCTPDELIEHTRQHIAGYKKPRSLIIAPELPRDISGRIDRGAVHQKWGS